jgi:hypothetical protein
LKAELMEEERKRKHAEEVVHIRHGARLCCNDSAAVRLYGCAQVRMAERTGRITAERRLTAALQQLPQV